jgi:hypothetical protein
MERVCPIKIKGVSTGQAPIHVNKAMSIMKIQKRIWAVNKFLLLGRGEIVSVNGRIRNTRIDIRRQTTPPNLLGMERRIAYAKRKYHSGWI